jgi:hypothetical protein
MDKIFVLLESGTVGEIKVDNPKIGDVVEVYFHDENGNEKTETGAIEQII